MAWLEYDFLPNLITVTGGNRAYVNVGYAFALAIIEYEKNGSWDYLPQRTNPLGYYNEDDLKIFEETNSDWNFRAEKTNEFNIYNDNQILTGFGYDLQQQFSLLQKNELYLYVYWAGNYSLWGDGITMYNEFISDKTFNCYIGGELVLQQTATRDGGLIFHGSQNPAGFWRNKVNCIELNS